MSLKAVPHDLADRPLYGTPRVPPFVMLCQVSASRCGRVWIANTVQEYQSFMVMREAHHKFCTVPDKKPTLHL